MEYDEIRDRIIRWACLAGMAIGVLAMIGVLVWVWMTPAPHLGAWWAKPSLVALCVMWILIYLPQTVRCFAMEMGYLE